jgi:hypothetical protein
VLDGATTRGPVRAIQIDLGIQLEIIALSGFARAGKDEAAKVLVEEFGFIQVAFADKLREMLYALNPKVETEWFMTTIPKPAFEWRVQDVINEYGWDGYKETRYGPEIRRLLQRLGTEAGRQTLWDTIWIDAAFANVPEDSKVVVSDARFFNEFDAVRDRGGEIWRIERPGVGPVSNHPSETEAVGYTHFAQRINNDGTLEAYYQKIRDAYENRWQVVGYTTEGIQV